MQDKLSKLESKLAEELSKVPREDFITWLAHPATKALLLQLDVDLEELKENWAWDKFDDKENIKAQGQAMYIKGFKDVIRSLVGDEE